MVEIIQERLKKVTALASGAHEPSKDEFVGCAMEAAAWIAGEPWSDQPKCVCPIIGAFMRAWNDGLLDDERNELLLPLVPKTIGTRGSSALADRRSLMSADWLVRVNTPAWLRLAGLTEQAETLQGLSEITSTDQVPSIRGLIEAVRDDAHAARAAARAATWAATWDAAASATLAATLAATWATAWATAWATTWDATFAATLDAARAATWDAGRAIAESATWGTLQDTKKQLQRSAVDLVERMIAADEPEKIAA